MNRSYNPYGTLSGMGRGQTPKYAPMGTYSSRSGSMVQRPARSGYGYDDRAMENPRWAAPQAYGGRAMANMQSQLQYDGDNRAYEWWMSMMSPDEMMREWYRYS
jgi:hypothetical protein